MAASYEIYLYSPAGVQLMPPLTTRSTGLEWSRQVNGLGSFEITLSDRLTPVDTSLFQLNGQVKIYRKASAFDTPRFEMLGFIRGWDFSTDEKGVTRYKWHGPDQNALLASRVCFPWHPYTGGFWQTAWTRYADTSMRELVEDNMGAGSSNSALRDVVTSNGAGLTIAVESSATTTSCTTAGQMTFEYGGKNLLTALQELSHASRTYIAEGLTAAVPVYFDMCLDTDTALTFRTFATRRGMNHRADSGQAVHIGVPYGNLVEPRWVHDRTNEVNAGLGFIHDGLSEWKLDATRIGQAPLNRREAASTAGEELGVTADALINEGKPKPKFTGRIQDTPQYRYGVHWGLGDELSCDFMAQQYPVRVTDMYAKCAGGFERLQPTFEMIE